MSGKYEIARTDRLVGLVVSEYAGQGTRCVARRALELGAELRVGDRVEERDDLRAHRLQEVIARNHKRLFRSKRRKVGHVLDHFRCERQVSGRDLRRMVYAGVH